MKIPKPNKQAYQKLLEEKSPNSKLLRNMLRAFLVGGAICTIGQALSNLYTAMGLETDTGAAWTSITLVFLGGLLTALHLYEKLAKFAGAGSLVPITGFANAVVSPAMEFRAEGFILGTGAKMFIIAGPVIVYGVLASVVYGAVLVVLGM